MSKNLICQNNNLGEYKRNPIAYIMEETDGCENQN